MSMQVFYEKSAYALYNYCYEYSLLQVEAMARSFAGSRRHLREVRGSQLQPGGQELYRLGRSGIPVQCQLNCLNKFLCYGNYTCHVRFTCHHLSLTTSHFPPVIFHLSFTTCHSPPVIYLLSFTTCHLPPVTYHLSLTTYHYPPITTCHSPPITCYLPPITCHLLPVACHLPPDTNCLLLG